MGPDELLMLRALFEQWKQSTFFVEYEPDTDDTSDEDLGDLCYESSGYAVGTYYPYRGN
jgi:hypothetical protein